jgi:TonB family protein
LKNKSKPESFIRQPNYTGGNKALNEFIASNVKYPEEALNNKIEGSVNIKYDVNVFGDVTAAAVVQGIGYGCDEEALRVVKLLKFDKKKYKKLHVIFHKKIIIHFHLPGKAPKPEQQKIIIKYRIIPTETKT